MNSRIIAVAAGVLTVSALLTAPGVTATPAHDSAAALKAAARARLAATEADLVIDHYEITRLLGDYADVQAFPDLKRNETDPAHIILHRVGGKWQAVAGPGTAFAPEDLGGAPADILNYDNPYLGDAATASIAAVKRIAGGENLFSSSLIKPLLQFDYPANATLTQQGENTHLHGPPTQGGPFDGRAYDMVITPLQVNSNGPLDDFAYAQLQDEIRLRGLGPDGQPITPQAVNFYHLAQSDVFQIDWFAGDSTQSEFYLSRLGGGPVTEIETRIYPVQNNPAAPQAEGALNLILHTLTSTAAGAVPGMPRTGAADTKWGEPAAVGGVALLLLLAGYVTRRRYAQGRH